MLYEWLWLGIWLVDSVVLPTVPETPGHHPQPRVYRRSDADHIMPGIVRRQAAGGLGADPGQAVRMGLAATGSICALLAGRVAFGLCRRSVCTYAKRMRMARHLGFREGRGADSAGKIF